MRITVVTTWFPTDRTPGAGSFIARDVSALAVDHDVRVLHLSAPESDDGRRRLLIDGVDVTRVPIDVRRPLGAIRAGRVVAAFLRAHPTDVLHTMAAPALIPFLVRRPEVPWVHTEHWSGVAHLAGQGRSRHARPVVRRGYDGPDAVVAVSDYLAESVRRLRAGTTQVVGNIVEPVSVQVDAGARPGVDGIRVLAVGNVIEHKGWRPLVDAIALLRAEGHAVSLTWLGQGPELEDLRRRGLAIGIHAPGQVDRSQVDAALGHADVFVLATRSETFSLATVEALSAGVPVVTTGVGAHTGFVTPEAGIVVERSAEGLAMGIRHAAALDREAVRRRGAQLTEQFSESQWRRTYAQIYEEVGAGVDNRGSTATVDMVVAVHDLRRNIQRAIGSFLKDPDPTIRALVVAHNLPKEDVAAELADLLQEHPGRIRIEELPDGIPSPSGPFNLGMSVSDADYVGIMGSDDELDPGAIAQWRSRAERHRADAVIAKVVRGERRNLMRSPPKRVWRTGVLDFARDRLSYRSSPVGLMRREAVGRLGLHLQPGARNGGDLPFVTRLWYLGRVIADQGSAAYIEHADAPVRVTFVAKPVREELGSVLALLEDPLVESMPLAAREALVTKLLRRNVTDSVRKRDSGRGFTADDIAVLGEVFEAARARAPRALDLISLSQRRAFDELRTPEPDLERIAALDEEAADLRTVAALRPARWHLIAHPQAQPRFVLASALIKIGASRFFPAARVAAPLVVGGALVLAGSAIVRRKIVK